MSPPKAPSSVLDATQAAPALAPTLCCCCPYTDTRTDARADTHADTRTDAHAADYEEMDQVLKNLRQAYLVRPASSELSGCKSGQLHLDLHRKGMRLWHGSVAPTPYGA